MAAQEHTARGLLPHGRNCSSESLLIMFRTATWRWPVRSQLAERKIKPEDSHARGAERIRQCHEKWGVAVRSRAMRQDEAITGGIGRVVQALSMAVHTHRLLQPNGCDHFS